MATTLLAWATDPELRRNGSSGGFIRAMQIWMLETGAVDWVLHARTGREGDIYICPEYVATNTPYALRGRKTCSVYYPVWNSAVCVEYDKSYAATVLPCYMPVIRLHPEIVYTFELLCHHTPRYEWTTQIAETLGAGACPGTVAYRGNGWPGELTINDKTVPHTKYWSNDVQKWGLPKCKHCTRVHSPDTDFVCGDPWGYKGEMGDGKTMVLAQTARAEKLLEQAIAASVIATEPLDRAFWDKRIRNHRK